jgi:hypothetical protein
MIQRPVVYCPFCEVAYDVPVYERPDGSRYYRWNEAQNIADRHITSHATDCVQEIADYLARI